MKKTTKKAAKKVAKGVRAARKPKGPVREQAVGVKEAGGVTASTAGEAVVSTGVAALRDASRDFAVRLAELVRASRCHNVVVLDVKGLSPVTDYLVIGTGTSGRQMRSTADDAVELGQECDYRPLSKSGLDSETWICVDFVHVLLHLFNEESRGYYDLESLWGDAKRVELGGE